MLDRFTHQLDPTLAASGRPRAATNPPWLRPQGLEYLPLDEQMAVVRLVAALHNGFAPPAGAALVVEGPDAILRSDPLGSLSHRVPRRLRASNELLWRVTFALPLDLVQYPEAIFSLVAGDVPLGRLSSPTLATLAALSEPWPVGPRTAPLLTAAARRRAAALGTAIAVAGSSTVSPVLALAANGSSGQPAAIHPVTVTAPSSDQSGAPAHLTAPHKPASSSSSSHQTGGTTSGHHVSLAGDVASAHHPRTAKRAAARSAASSHTAGAASSGRKSTARKSTTHHDLPSPASAAGSSGTDPGSTQAPAAPASPVLAAVQAHEHGSTQSEGTWQDGASSTLTPNPPGSLKGGSHVGLPAAVGHLQPGRHHASSGPHHGGGHAVAVKGAHPLGAGGGTRAAGTKAAHANAPKPKPRTDTDGDTPSSDGTSGYTPGGNPFTTGIGSSYSRLASMYAQTDQPPPFLIPIYKKAGVRFRIPWAILAAINSVETDYGRNVNTSSAGAVGWMQFMPSTWAQYGMAIDHSGPPNPYNPADAIFSAAHYLAANGGAKNLRQAIYAYNHATWYVDEVMVRAQLIRDHVQHGLVNPFPLGWAPNRLDLGYDGTFTGAILAPFSGTITYAARSFSNWGGYLELRADKPVPGLPSDTLYFAEGLAPTAKAGEHVSAGQVIAVPAPSPYGNAYNTTSGGAGQIEWGVASPGPVGSPTNPLAESAGRPTSVVIAFAIWVVKNLGLVPPSQTNHAGYA